MINILKSKLFWITAVIFAVIFFVFTLNASRNYMAEMRVLILPKGVAARNAEQIVENARQIPLSLSFYDRLAAGNPDLENLAVGLPDKERKDFWNSKVEIKRIRKSGIIAIRFFDANQFNAELSSRAIANDLAVVLSKYYNIKTELDVRFIDGPIVSTAFRINPIGLAAGSLALGLLIVSVLSAGINQARRAGSALRKGGARFSLPEKKPEFSKKETTISSSRRAQAPDNLPIAEEAEIEGIREIPEIKMSDIPSREATPEEVRERLNKLLRGDL